MTNVQIVAGTLTASRQDRIISGLLLPYGEKCRSNLGKFSIDRGTISLPADPSVVGLNVEHEREAPVGRALTLTDTDAGIVATFSVAKTPEGDAYLSEVENGTRRSLSAEVAGVVIKAGKAVAGRLFGAAACEAGAFPSATLMASDVGDDVELADEQDPTTTTDAQSEDEAAAAADQEDPTMGDTTAAVEDTTDEQEQTLHAALPGSLKSKRATPETKGASLFARLAQAHGSVNQGTLLAALDNIIQADAEAAQVKQWLGEIYQSRTYVRRYADLISHGDLNGLHAVGWRFVEGSTPTVADYAGFPAQPNSTVTLTQAVTLDAQRIAGAAAVDRAFQDFKVDGFWEGFYREVTNDYERKIDAKVIGLLTTAGNFTAVNSSLATTPANVARAAALIVDGAMSIINAERGLPTFAIVGSALYRDLLLTRADDLLAFLNASLGLEEGSMAGFQIVPSANAALTNKVVVGSKDAATLYELPGSPIRVDTVNVGTGGIETGVFGYWAGLGNDAKGVALVTPVA